MTTAWEEKKVLVTGGAGFIGSRLVRALESAGASVVVLDNFRTGKRSNLDGTSARLIEGDLRSAPPRREALEGVHTVFHLAAFVSVAESMTDPETCYDVNTEATRALLTNAVMADVQRVVFSSSAAIYGERPENPKHENVPPDPKSPYALSKLDGEQTMAEFFTRKKLSTASLRYFNVFGPGQDPNGPYAAAVPAFFQRARANEPIIIFGDGEQTRDFIHVDDIVAANMHIATLPECTSVYNVAHGAATSINELAQNIIEATNSSSVIEHHAERPGDILHSLADASRLRETGWDPAISVADGLHALASA